MPQSHQRPDYVKEGGKERALCASAIREDLSRNRDETKVASCRGQSKCQPKLKRVSNRLATDKRVTTKVVEAKSGECKSKSHRH